MIISCLIKSKKNIYHINISNGHVTLMSDKYAIRVNVI